MGPLSEESGELQSSKPGLLAGHYALQWGRSPKRAESRLDGARLDGARLLQWGRSPKRAESTVLRGTRAPRRDASMGPLSEESGERSRSARPALASRSFNGAALRRERRARRTRGGCASRTRASMGPLSEESGERCSALDPCAARSRASMGPLSEESGERDRRRESSLATRRASMGPLSEESGEAVADADRRRTVVASMGPLSEESGESAYWIAGGVGGWKLQWGRSPKRAERSRGPGPPRARRGRFNGAALRRERRAVRRERGFDDVRSASMGPLSEESGELRGNETRHRVRRGFNGAALRRERRGSTYDERTNRKHVKLQWGRSPKRAESVKAGQDEAMRAALLQWGRSQMRAVS